MLNKEQRQELIEFSIMAMASQGVPGMDRKKIHCRYMAEDGTRCGIGHMLDEDDCHHYDTLGVSANVIAVDKVNGWDACDGNFLDKWQQCHDQAAKDAVKGKDIFLDGFRRRAEYFCKVYGLRFPEEYI